MKTANQISDVEEVQSTDKILCRIGGAAAFIAMGFGILQIVIEIIGVGFMHIEIPTTPLGWFIILQDHWLLGLTALTIFQIPALIFCVPVFLALYVSLKRIDKANVMVAVVLAFLGLAVYISSNTVFSILSLSRQYAAATTAEVRQMLIAAGHAMFAIYEGIGVDVGLFLFMVAILLISRVMLRSKIFYRTSAYLGILTGVIAILYYLSSMFSPIAIFIYEIAGLFFLFWLILVGRKLLQLGYRA